MPAKPIARMQARWRLEYQLRASEGVSNSLQPIFFMVSSPITVARALQIKDQRSFNHEQSEYIGAA